MKELVEVFARQFIPLAVEAVLVVLLRMMGQRRRAAEGAREADGTTPAANNSLARESGC